MIEYLSKAHIPRLLLRPRLIAGHSSISHHTNSSRRADILQPNHSLMQPPTRITLIRINI